MKKQQNVQKPLKRLLSLLLVVVLLAGQMGGALSALAWDTGNGDDSDESGISTADLDDNSGSGGEGDNSGTGDEGDTSSTVTFTLSSDSSNVTLSATSAELDTDNNYTVTLTATDSYALPENITVVCGNEAVSEYTWDYSTGTLSINKEYVTAGSTVTITAVATPTENEEKTTYTVTLVLNGATLTNTEGYYIENNQATISAASGTLTLPTKDNMENTGYDFGGWYTKSDFSDSDPVTAVSYTSDQTLYAKWTKTIYFSANGGTIAGDAVSVTGTGSETITPPTATYTGYTLTGWNRSANGSGDALADSATFADVTNGETYYAQWKAITVTFTEGSNLSEYITMTSSGNTVTLTPDDYYSVDNSTITLSEGNETINSSNYNVTSDGNSDVVTITLTGSYVSNLTSNVTLTVSASAKAKSYEVEFEGSGYTVTPETNTATYETNLTVTIAAKDGYTLTDAAPTVTVGGTTLTGGVTWTQNDDGSYTLKIAGESITENITVTVGTVLNANSCGYTLNSYSDEGTSLSYTAGSLSGNAVVITPSGNATQIYYSDGTNSAFYDKIIIGTNYAASLATNSTLVLPDGDYTESTAITFSLADDSGVTTANTYSVNVNVDTTDPKVEVDATSGVVTVDETVYTNGGATYTLTASDDNLDKVTIAVTKADGTSGSLTYEYRGNGWSKNSGSNIDNVSVSVNGSNSSTTTFTATLTLSDQQNKELAEGTYTITLSATDKAGNETDNGSTDAAAVTVDKTAPEVMSETFTVTGTNGESEVLTQEEGSSYYKVNKDFTYSLALTDSASGVDTSANIKAYLVYSDSSTKELTTEWNSTTLMIAVDDADLKDGETHQIKITGIADNAGNEYTTTTGEGWSQSTEAVYYSASFRYDKDIPNATVDVETKGKSYESKYYSGDVTVTLTVEGDKVDWTDSDNDGFYTATNVTLTINNTSVDLSSNDYFGDNNGFTKVDTSGNENAEATYSVTFTLSAPTAGTTNPTYQYVITLEVTDNTSDSGNKTDTKTVIFDTTAPTESITDGESNVDTTDWGTTWAQSRTVAVTFDDPEVTTNVAGSGVNTSTIGYYIEAAEGSDTANLTNTEVGSASSPITYNGETLTIAANDNTTFEGTLYITATDNVGNTNTVKIALALDADAPDVTVSAPYYKDNTSPSKDGDTYYANAGVTYPLTVEDDELASVTVTVTNPTADEDAAPVFTQTLTYTDGAWTAGTATGSTIVTLTEGTGNTSEKWTATLAIAAGDENANYTVTVTATDSATNDGSDSSTLVMDVTDPTAGVTYKGSSSGGWGHFTNTDLEYTLTATDETLLDRIVVTVVKTTGNETESKEYTLSYTANGWGTVNENNIKITAETSSNEKNLTATLKISAQGKVDSDDYKITIVSYDKAGNNSEPDTEEQVIDTVAPDADVSEPSGTTTTVESENGTVYYSNTTVTYELTASDTNVLYTVDVTVTVDGTDQTITYVYTETENETGEWTVQSGSLPTGVEIELDKSNSGTNWAATLTIPATDGTYVVSIKATDGAGNNMPATSDTLIIDTVDPVSTVSNPDTYTTYENGTYYGNGAVTYTLTVVDANIDTTEMITVTVTNENSLEYEIKQGETVLNLLANGDAAVLTSWEEGENNTYTATLTITPGDGVVSDSYVVAVTATDLATNEGNKAESETLVLDTTDPVNFISDPSYTSSSETSGDRTIDYANQDVVYYLSVTDANIDTNGITVKVNGSATLPSNATLSDWSKSVTYGISTWTATLTLAASDNVTTSNYVVTLDSTDKAGNDGNQATTDTLVIDTVAPTVTYTDYSGNVYASDYYANTTSKVSNSGDSNYYVFAASADTALKVTVTVTDANIDMTGEKITVTRYSSLADAKSRTGGSVDYVPGDWSSNADGTIWTQTVTIPANAQEGYYVLTLTATDKAANAYATNSVGTNTGATANVLVNDTTAPNVTASVANPTNIGSYGGKNVYYVTASGDLAVTFSISDNNDLLTNANGDNSSYKFTLYKYDSAGSASVVTVPASAGNFSGWSGSATSKTGTYTLDRSALGLSDGIYAVELTVTDQAGNSTTYRSDYLVIDTTAPTGQIEAGGSGFSGFWKELLSTITFGLYSNDGISYTLTWDDNSDSFLNSTEGVKSVQYAIYDLASGSQAYTTTSALAAATNVSWQSVSNVSADSASASVGNDDKFVIYLRIEDMAGNVTYISSDGLITENDPSQINSDTTDPEILVTVANENGNTSGVHDSSVSLGVEIVEYPNIIFSGIDQSTIAYTISDGYDGSVSLSTTDGTGMTFSTNADGLKGSGNQTVVVSVPEGYESDQIYLTATVTDNAGNAKTVDYTALNVDNRTPTATVTYDNNTAYNSYYFNSARVATIVIQEMNFDSSNTQVTTEGSLSGWTTTGTGSETTNTATVTYDQDGDYTIAIQSTDLAGHTMTDGDVVYEGVATRSFTIDMTAPTVSVTFTDASGNTVPSGGYANSTVTATITVVEHNFDASSATSGIHITRDGETYTPSISWSNNGDVHTAVITFTEEEGAYYTFDISFIDLANNQSAAFSTQSFYVDTMAPSVVVDNISNNSANNAAVIAPVITITDKYYDEANVTVTLTGAKTGVVANAYTVTDTENGQIFTFNNIEADDIYTITVTVTDLAGNVIETMYVTDSEESTDNLTFSVNRNGSTYQVDEDTAALLESYYVSSIDDDVVIEIINVDPIEDIVITVTRGLLRSWDLTEGEDYSIVEEEITGGYRYTITIFKEVFDEDGAYSISIYTEDAAGNTSTNNTANDDQAIQLDFYLDSEGPIIVLNDLDKNGRYNYSAYDEASVSVTDATLEEITVDIIYQDGTGTKTYTWGEEEIYAEDFTGTFIATLDEEKAIAESTSQIRIEISARDKAGNVAYGPVDEETNEVDDNYYFTVSTNPFVRFFANKPLFYGTIAALILIILLIILLIVLRRKKSEEETGETVQEDTKGKEKAEEK